MEAVGVPDGSSDRQEFVCSQIITEPPGFVNKSLRRNLTNHATEFPPLLRGCPNVIAGRPSGRLGILVLANLLGNGAVLSDPGGRPFRRSHQMVCSLRSYHDLAFETEGCVKSSVGSKPNEEGSDYIVLGGQLLAQDAKVTPLMTKDLTGIAANQGTMLTVEYAPGA